MARSMTGVPTCPVFAGPVTYAMQDHYVVCTPLQHAVENSSKVGGGGKS